MKEITAVTAIAAGVASFLSPCVLPLVPGYVSFMSGLSLDELSRERDRPDVRRIQRGAGPAAACFVLGFSLVFVLMGASASALGQFVDANRSWLSHVGGVVVILFGLHMMGLVPIKLLYYEKRLQATGVQPGFVGAFLMGLAFAFGWTPCIGPILSTILILAAKEGSAYKGMFLLALYSLGLGIPFILTGFATAAFLRFFKRFRPYIGYAETASGAVLVAVGLLLLRNQLTLLNSLVPKAFSRLG